MQNKGLEHQLQTYMAMLAEEKERASKHIETVEIRMREMQVREYFSTCDVIVLQFVFQNMNTWFVCRLQDVLVMKMRELNTARESQVSLKTEIDNFRSLMEEEERRYVRHVFRSEHTCSF